ncbi:MAG: 16S rRNA (guanine(527)-N(7))-methyltransferase RsmG [Pseudomonadota bacterium]
MYLPSPKQAVTDLHALSVTATSEMSAALCRYCDLLAQWQARINLVGPKTLETVWGRHILDSAQLVPHIPAGATLTDIGSGAGFPALVLAILRPDLKVTCVESDTRKCAFLQTVVRELHLNVRVVNNRIEGYDWAGTDILTARALASLDNLTPYLLAAKAVNPLLTAILPKGAQWRDEIINAPQLAELFHVKHVPSHGQPEAVILILSPR